MKEDWIVCRVVHEFEVFGNRGRGEPRPWPDLVNGNLYVIHSQSLDCFGFRVVFGAQVDDGFDTLFLQKLKTCSCRLSSSVEAIGNHGKTGNVSSRGGFRNRFRHPYCGHKHKECKHTSHWYVSCTLSLWIGVIGVFDVWRHEMGASFHRALFRRPAGRAWPGPSDVRLPAVDYRRLQ